MRKVAARLASLKQTKPHEYAVRFLFGGLSTVLAGLIARHFGPVIGGLFLAFPAIFPASATLIEAQQKRNLARVGADGTNRGRLAAAIDARGAALGCIGLATFAFILWKFLPAHGPIIVIAVAAIAWMLVAYALWLIPKHRPARHT